MRNFKFKGISFQLINLPYNSLKEGYKYDILMFDMERNGWVRFDSCKTLKHGRELVEEKLSYL